MDGLVRLAGHGARRPGLGPSLAIAADGTRGHAAAQLTGYTIITAESLEAAAEKAKGCPGLTSGGSIEVYEALEMGGHEAD
jgi:hypothetical protein